MYIFLAILAFGIIIAIHELGHFFAAKALNVKVVEFAIGMGPKILSKQGKETLYSLRLLPFGGFCNMEGEYGEKLEKDNKDETIENADYDVEEEPDPRSFMAQARWKRIVILAAGSVANIVAAFVIVIFLNIGADGYRSTTISRVEDKLPSEGFAEIMAGDRITAINGERLYYYDDYRLFMNLNAGKPITLEILRNGERIEYNRRAYTVDGEQIYRYNIGFSVIEPSLWNNLKYSVYQMYSFVRMIRVSISMMISGAASVTEVSGPVGIVSAMNTVARESPNILAGIANIVYLTAFIGVNVAIVNLLPIPAMDGGRILFVCITWVIEKTTRRKLNPKYENYINTGAFVLLIGLMALIMYNDVMRIINN